MIEVQNETDEDRNVVVCRSVNTGKVFVHLLGDGEEFHGDEATTVPAKDYEIIEPEDKAV